MNGQDYEQLTLSVVDSLVSHSPWLESVREKTMIVTCGRKCSELSETLNQLGFWVRTYLESCKLPGGSWQRIWSAKAMTSRCSIMKLRLSERRTDESGFSLWATPTQRDYKGSNSMEHLTRETKRKNGSHQAQLANQVKLFPTPRANSSTGASQAPHRQGSADLQTVIAMFPTPTTGAGLNGGTGNFQQLQKLADIGVISEEERRNMSQGNGGQLNPTWVEWLMGVPIGWTDLNA